MYGLQLFRRTQVFFRKESKVIYVSSAQTIVRMRLDFLSLTKGFSVVFFPAHRVANLPQGLS